MGAIGLFGGSFNPVHVGHVRLAIEVLEYTKLPYTLDRVELIPCATPVHKEPGKLLPFELRYAMLEASCASVQGLYVNAIEHERQGLSYTWHTLEAYKKKHPSQRLLFMLGIENLCDLPHWYRGLQLLKFADIGVVPRAGGDEELFRQKVGEHWPGATITQGACPSASVCLPPQDDFASETTASIYYMPLPRIDISASYIREKWLAGGSLCGLMPEPALDILERARNTAQRIWK